MSERKYRDDEVAEILDLAVRPDVDERPMASSDDGLTLAQLQEVGREVGVDPERIARAAQTLESRQGLMPRRTSLGMPVGVARVIDLPRAVTEEEWGYLVSEFRQTFAAQGKLASRDGALVWKNGNLRATLEPTASGHRLRLETKKSGAEARNGLGIMGLSVAAASVAWMANFGSPLATEMILMWSMAIGSGMLGLNVVQLPRWAREREEQMEYLDGRVRALITADPPESSSE